jgi:predicted nucleotidyltransferase
MTELNILLSGVVGSTAYGLAGPDSDVDRLGVFAAPTTQLHGLHPPVGKAASVVRHEPDVTYHEAGKLAALCLGGNPTVTELLWLESYETHTPLGAELVAIRSAFTSARRCRDAYLGYAAAQFHRLLNTGQFQSKMRKRVEKHARHLLRLLDQGYELYSTGFLTIRLAERQRYIEFGQRVAADPDAARPALAAAEVQFDTTRSVLPDAPDERTVEDWLLRVRQAYYTPTDVRP